MKIYESDITTNTCTQENYDQLYMMLTRVRKKDRTSSIPMNTSLESIREMMCALNHIKDTTIPIEQFADIFIDEFNHEYPSNPLYKPEAKKKIVETLEKNFARVSFVPKVIGPNNPLLRLDPSMEEGLYLIPLAGVEYIPPTIMGGPHEYQVDGHDTKKDICDFYGHADQSVQEQSES